MTKPNTESVRDEDLRVGDTVFFLGRARRILEIKPYTGPLTDIVFAIAHTDLGGSFSLCFKSWTEKIV